MLKNNIHYIHWRCLPSLVLFCISRIDSFHCEHKVMHALTEHGLRDGYSLHLTYHTSTSWVITAVLTLFWMFFDRYMSEIKQSFISYLPHKLIHISQWTDPLPHSVIYSDVNPQSQFIFIIFLNTQGKQKLFQALQGMI